MATSRSKIQGLEGKVREIETGGLDLKRAMKEAVDGVFWYTKHVHYTLVWI
jgi:exonuclease VII small subunit